MWMQDKHGLKVHMWLFSKIFIQLRSVFQRCFRTLSFFSEFFYYFVGNFCERFAKLGEIKLLLNEIGLSE